MEGGRGKRIEKRVKEVRRRKLKDGGNRKKERKEIYKVTFWNVAGLKNKDEDFWKDLKEWDIMVMSERVDNGR